MIDRRDLLKGAGLAALAAGLGSTRALALDTVTLPLANGERVKVLRGRPLSGVGAPGQVLRASRDGVEVAAGRGSYLLEEVQPPGRRPTPARAVVMPGA